jgi:serine protease
VAVVDTGVRFEHPDLLAVADGGKLLPGYNMISNVTVANDGDGRDADASDPGDWITAAEANNHLGFFYGCTVLNPSTGKYSAEDSSWHGTQVSGIIAAITNNGIGMAGVGPSLRVLPVRVLGKCGGYDSDIIAGMRWAAGLP